MLHFDLALMFFNGLTEAEIHVPNILELFGSFRGRILIGVILDDH